MSDVYRRLATRLNEMPHGFPPTESGVELKILEKIFSEDDASLALKLRNIPEAAVAISERIGVSQTELVPRLDLMAEKGQIGRFRWGETTFYLLMPFVVGIYEFQMYRIDRELAELFEEYAPTLMGTLGGFAPAMARVVPIHEAIENRGEILPFEDITKIIEDSQSFVENDCICRKERSLLGDPCSHTRTACLAFSREENAFNAFPLGGKRLTKDEAKKLLSNAEQEGLVHNIFYNTGTGHFAVCNCCPCCCGLIRGLKDFGAPHVLARSNYEATIDVDTCSSCGICAEERCPMGAITEDNGKYAVDRGRCIGCGVCQVTCPTEAISLLRRPEAERSKPPATFMEWILERAKNRGVELKIE